MLQDCCLGPKDADTPKSVLMHTGLLGRTNSRCMALYSRLAWSVVAVMLARLSMSSAAVQIAMLWWHVPVEGVRDMQLLFSLSMRHS